MKNAQQLLFQWKFFLIDNSPINSFVTFGGSQVKYFKLGLWSFCRQVMPSCQPNLNLADPLHMFGQASIRGPHPLSSLSCHWGPFGATRQAVTYKLSDNARRGSKWPWCSCCQVQNKFLAKLELDIRFKCDL